MAPKHGRSKTSRNKISLVFDEAKRREFLTGFHKRKLQRKKQAQENLKQQLKAEQKRLKQEARESYKKLVLSHRPVPEVSHLLSKEYDEGEATVRIVEMSTSSIAAENNLLGENKPAYESDDSKPELQLSDGDDDVPGMNIKDEPTPKVKPEKMVFVSEKDVKRNLKKQATKNVQRSKAFRMKNRLERDKNKKKSSQKRKENIKQAKRVKKRKK